MTGEKRSSLFPELPTAVESGYPSVVIDNWFAVLAPANLDSEAKEKLLTALGEVVEDPTFQEKLRAQGAEPSKLLGDDLKNLMISDIERWKKVVSDANVSITN